MLKALIFDFDGVLVDSLPAVYRCYKKLEEAGFFKRAIGDFEEFKQWYSTDWLKTYRFLGVSDLRGAEEFFNRNIKELYKSASFCHGIEVLLDRLAEDYKLGIATNGDARLVRKKLEQKGLSKKIMAIVGTSSSEELKPAPQLILRCIAELCVKPEETVVIGDTPNDIIAGRRAGCYKSIGVCWSGSFSSEARLKLAKPDAIASTPQQLFEILEGFRSVSKTTEQPHPKTTRLNQLSDKAALNVLLDCYLEIFEPIRAAIPKLEQAAKLIKRALDSGHKIYHVGAGSSGREGIVQVPEQRATFGTEEFIAFVAGGESALTKSVENAEDNFNEGYAVISGVARKGDIIIVTSAHGDSLYALGALEAAREKGCKSITICFNENSRISKKAHIALEMLLGPEPIAGSTKMKCRTAQKILLDLLLAVAQKHKLYGNRMVNVSASSKKIDYRKVAMVAELGQVGDDEAAALLEAVSNPATAILMARTGLNKDEAKSALTAHNHDLSRALKYYKAR